MCNWSRETILTALGGVQPGACGRRLTRSSYLRVVTLYIHPFLELTLLQPGSVKIKLLLAFSFCQELPPSFYDASRRYNQPIHDRAASRLSILNLNVLALQILNATGLALSWELPQLYLGRQMV
jgi:hypothetical protein